MASELRVNTLKDASGNNSVATSTVAQGSAKAWLRYDAVSGTPVVDDSFNMSILTDHAVGKHTASITSAMANGDYAFSCGGSNEGSDARHMFNNNDAPATTSFRWKTEGINSGSATDGQNCSVTINGDLA